MNTNKGEVDLVSIGQIGETSVIAKGMEQVPKAATGS